MQVSRQRSFRAHYFALTFICLQCTNFKTRANDLYLRELVGRIEQDHENAGTKGVTFFLVPKFKDGAEAGTKKKKKKRREDDGAGKKRKKNGTRKEKEVAQKGSPACSLQPLNNISYRGCTRGDRP